MNCTPESGVSVAGPTPSDVRKMGWGGLRCGAAESVNFEILWK